MPSTAGGRRNQRQQAIDGFRNGRYKILVATDVAARGLDVQGISHVVNFDIPATTDDYIHRIGRHGPRQMPPETLSRLYVPANSPNWVPSREY